MKKLNEIIEQMALEQFRKDTESDKRWAFVLENATLGEFVDFYTNKKTAHGVPWFRNYASSKLKGMNGLVESFVREVLWERMKDLYIEKVVKDIESKITETYKITIEKL